MKLICVGDSLTFGFGVGPSKRWTNLCMQRTGWEMVNEGINGDTTGGMLARLQAKLLPELTAGGFGAERPRILLMGGSNDIFYSAADVTARSNMGAMIHQLLARGICPLVGIPLPVDAERAPENWAAAVDFHAAAVLMEGYCLWLKQYCAAFGVPYVDFHADFLLQDGTVHTSLLIDGLHPTAEGHRLMAERLCRQLC